MTYVAWILHPRDKHEHMKYKAYPCSAWAVLFRQVNKVDGAKCHLVHQPISCVPFLYRTRKQAKLFIEQEFGYIRRRKDLQDEPHGWRMPIPIRVNITIIQLTKKPGIAPG